MIEFHYETEFSLKITTHHSDWLTRVIKSENALCGCIDCIFCSDEVLLEMNKKYLGHDTFTDVITFDYTEGNIISGDIFISAERLKENAAKFDVSMLDETLRVMVHGVLHLLGYNDKSESDRLRMRLKEEEKMKLFHVEQ